jgi:hypothetical protein
MTQISMQRIGSVFLSFNIPFPSKSIYPIVIWKIDKKSGDLLNLSTHAM